MAKRELDAGRQEALQRTISKYSGPSRQEVKYDDPDLEILDRLTPEMVMQVVPRIPASRKRRVITSEVNARLGGIVEFTDSAIDKVLHLGAQLNGEISKVTDSLPQRPYTTYDFVSAIVSAGRKIPLWGAKSIGEVYRNRAQIKGETGFHPGTGAI